MSETRIGFVGATGMMGHGMAGSLVRAGFPLAYVLRSEATERVADLDAAGATRLGSYAELGAESDVVVICVTGSEDVVQAVDGLLARPREGLIIVDSSTVEPAVTHALAAVAASKGVRYADAPLTFGRILVHMLAETSQHAGHIDILRELADASAGLAVDAPSVPGEWGDAEWAAYVGRLETIAERFPAEGDPLARAEP